MQGGDIGGREITLRYGAEPDQFGVLRLVARSKAEPGPGSGHGADGGLSPVAVLLHGGYWRAAYRLDLMTPLAEDLTRAGFATYNLEYRRVGSPGGGWPGTFEDVLSGIGAMVEVAPSHRLDLRRVVVIGHSAGGHLALWLSAEALHMLRPALVVGLAPVSDLVEAHRQRLSRDAVAELLGVTYAEGPTRYLSASPAARLPFGVRQLIVHGTADDVVPYNMSVAFHADARAHGDECELMSLPGARHFEAIDPTTREWGRIKQRIIEMTLLAR